MFYATFKESNKIEIAEFMTEAERDDWVNFQDPLSLFLHITIENCVFEREIFENQALIDSLHDVSIFDSFQDEFNNRITWYVYS